MDVLYQGALLAVLLALSAFFSSSESALFSLGRLHKDKFEKEGHKNRILTRLLMNKNRLLITILVGNNLVNVAASAIATSFATSVFGSMGIGIAVGIMTLMILMFGEIVPKSYAIHNNEKVSLLVSKPIYAFFMIIYPVVYILELMINNLQAFLKISESDRSLITEDEVLSVVKMGMEDGSIDPDEKELIDNVFEFDDTDVSEIMTPRVNMVSIDADESFSSIISLIHETNLSRIPVFEGSPDNMIGILYSKDLLKFVGKKVDRFDVRKNVRKALFVPGSKKIDELLKDFQLKKVHIAIVVDEYGGVEGLVTMEDVLEELVGEIYDETDESKMMVKKTGKKTFMVDGEAEVDDVEKRLQLKLHEGDEDFETISGLVLDHLGKIPAEGEMIDLDDITLSVDTMKKQKILKIKLQKK